MSHLPLSFFVVVAVAVAVGCFDGGDGIVDRKSSVDYLFGLVVIYFYNRADLAGWSTMEQRDDAMV